MALLQNSVRAPDFDKKHLKKVKGCIDWNIVKITMNVNIIVQIISMIKFIKIH